MVYRTEHNDYLYIPKEVQEKYPIKFVLQEKEEVFGTRDSKVIEEEKRVEEVKELEEVEPKVEVTNKVKKGK